jgi:hypothetical protein
MVPVNSEDVKLAVDLFKDAHSTVHTLWGLYSVAAFALLGYILAPKEPVPGRGKLALGFVFLIFALSNAHSLWEAQGIGYNAVNSIRTMVGCDSAGTKSPPQDLLCKLELVRPSLIVGFQLFFTAIALAGLYAAHRHEDWLRTRPAQK